MKHLNPKLKRREFLTSDLWGKALASRFLIDFLQERMEQGTIIPPLFYQCTCKYKTHFMAALFTYKGIILLFGLFLAWETRSVTIPALNDSKYIGMSVYNVVVLAIIGVTVAMALNGSMHHEIPYAISSLCLILGTSVTLLLLFVPKVVISEN